MGQNHMIIPIDADKVFGKIQLSIMTKTLKELGIEGTSFNLIKGIYKIAIGGNIIPNSKKQLLTSEYQE